MGGKMDRAMELYASGFACSQAIFGAFCPSYGMDEKMALQIACGLGGGVKSGDVCGAVTGAVLVIGLKHGQFDAADKDSRRFCSLRTEEFLRDFRARNTHTACRKLLGCDITTPEGKAKALAEDLFTTLCAGLVADAADILESGGY